MRWSSRRLKANPDWLRRGRHRDGASCGAGLPGSEAGAHHVIDRGAGDHAREILALVPDGVDRIAEIDLADNAELDVAVLAVGGAVATYATRDPAAALPYRPLAFKNITVQFFSYDDFPETANQDAARDLTAAVAARELRYPVAARFPSNALRTPTTRPST